MSSNSFGQIFRITTFGESHGPAIGVIIDGVPAGFAIDLDAVQQELDRRRPGKNPLSSPRQETDQTELLSGLFEGRSTGAPICLMIRNRDARPEDYRDLAQVFRPGHADFSTQQKYGLRDWRGGGRASGRETAARVAAGAVARQLLATEGVAIVGHALEIGGVRAKAFDRQCLQNSPLNCADSAATEEMEQVIIAAIEQQDSVGGVVEIRATGLPSGWGDPVFGKLDALLAGALMSIGAVKGVEVGDGFLLTRLRGSEANDAMGPEGFNTNHAGGVLGGISTGAELVVRAAVKPTPSIGKTQQTMDQQGQPTTLSIRGRHDPCIVPRLVPVAEAMVALTLADSWLGQRALRGA